MVGKDHRPAEPSQLHHRDRRVAAPTWNQRTDSRSSRKGSQRQSKGSERPRCQTSAARHDGRCRAPCEPCENRAVGGGGNASEGPLRDSRPPPSDLTSAMRACTFASNSASSGSCCPRPAGARGSSRDAAGTGAGAGSGAMARGGGGCSCRWRRPRSSRPMPCASTMAKSEPQNGASAAFSRLASSPPADHRPVMAGGCVGADDESVDARGWSARLCHS